MAGTRHFLTLLLLLLLSLNSCGDDDGPTGGGGGEDTIPFPNAVGMLWKYEVYDSLTSTTDTVWVSVTELIPILAGVHHLRWRTYWIGADSVYDRRAWHHGDTLEFSVDTVSGEPMMTDWYVFPLEQGSEWIAPIGNDTSRVTIFRSVTVPAGTFQQVARVDRKWNLDFEGGGSWSETWLADSAGIVKRHFLKTASDGGGPAEAYVNQTWELIEYDLTTFSQGQFPSQVGTEWVYLVVDTNAQMIDTVTVRVIAEANVSGADSATVWEYQGEYTTDTVWTIFTDNRVVVARDTVMSPLYSWYYEFPLAVGRHWGVETFAPLPVVDDKVLVTLWPGRVGHAFHYRMFGGGFNDYWTVEDWLVPGVGVVKRKYWQFGFWPSLEQEWTLLSFDPPR